MSDPRRELIRSTFVHGSARNAGAGVAQTAYFETKRLP